MCSLVVDLVVGTVTTMMGLSRGHWEGAAEESGGTGEVKGDKRKEKDLERWRELGRIGEQTERVVLSEQAVVVEDFWGPGKLEGVDMEWPTL